MSYLVTIPAYNEAEIIESTLTKVSEYLEKHFPDLIKRKQLRICVAINGSSDGTEKIVAAYMDKIAYISYTITSEKGRGIALDNTWKDAPENILMYIDSDLAYSLDDLGSMIDSYR